MKNKGWVKLWRNQFNSWISKKPFCDGYAWSYLYRSANYKDGVINFGEKRHEYIKIERGQFITSKLKLGKIFGWGRYRVNSFLFALKSDNMITYETNNRYIRITIINYEKYQQVGEISDNKTDNETAVRRTTTEQQPNITKNIKNVKNKYIETVYLTKEEHQKLIDRFGEKIAKDKIEQLNDAIMSKGYKYKSHYHTILCWDRKNKTHKTRDNMPILK